MKRIFASFLSFIIICGFIPAMSLTARAEVSGSGNDLTVVTTPFELQGDTAADNMKVEWNPVSGATKYTLYRSDADNGNYVELASSASTTYDDYDLNTSMTYYYKVSAIGASGVIATSEPAAAQAVIEPAAGLMTYDNTKVSFLKLKSKLLFDGIYYQYAFQSDSSGFTQIVEQTSSDGLNYSGNRVILSKTDNPELNANKFEAVSIVKHGSKVVMWAHYENNADYTLARVASISGTPGGSFTYHGSFQPQGNQSRDLNFFEDDDGSGYLVSASDNNANLKVYKLNEDWTNILPADVYPAVTLLANQQREAPAMIKKDGWYYLFTSQTAGWYPSQGGYISAQSIPELADAPLQPIGNTVTFGAQSGGIVQIGDHYVMMANRWSGGWATPDPALGGAWSSQRMLPITLQDGYAAYDYYSSIKYNADAGVVIPVQSGKILSLNKPTTLSASDSPGAAGYTAGQANDGISYAENNFFQPGANTGTFTWTVDLGKESAISQIDVTFRLTKGSETYSQYILSGSKDGNSFTTIKDQSSNRIVGFNENIISDPNTYRYVRIQVTGVKRASNNSDLNADWTRGFNELTVYGTPPAGSYTSVPVGAAWYDNEGKSIQAHGGGFVQQGGWYYWVGEDKSLNSHNTNGINLYKSKDLLNWELVSTILSNTTNPGYTSDSTPGLISSQTGQFNMERPKLIYDQASGKFVLYAHWENGTDYGNSHILIASASSVDGHYTVLHNFRPGAGHVGDPAETDASYTGSDGLWGYGSRDFTVYQDPGTGEAYLISTQDWQNMRVYKLTENSTNVDWEHSYQLFGGGKREAPAMIKSGGVYYIITSSQSGWYPNQAMYSYTTDISNPDGWSALQPLGNNTTFYSQPTNIMEVKAADGSIKYVYMGDRWNPDVLGASSYVWLPLNIDNSTHTMTMNYTPGWSLNPDNGVFNYPDVTNVSQGKPVDGEDNVVAGKLLKYINDGSYAEADTWSADTLYYQQKKVPYSVTFDLQDVYDLSRVDLSFKHHNGSEAYYAYTVQGSNDNKNWIVLADETQNKTAGFKSDMLKGKYRYVMLNITAVKNAHNNNSTADWSNGLLEAQVYANNLSKPLAALPAASEEGGTYTSEQAVTLSSTTSGAKIYYTTNGAEPTDRSPLYAGPVSLTWGHTVLKAVAYADGMESSGVLSKDFNIIDPNVIVSVTSPTEFAVTADEGAAGLPATLGAVNALGNAVTSPVSWNTAGLTFSPYTSMRVTGIMAGGYQVNATVDVINANLTYFISGGSIGVSSFFTAAKTRLDGQLVNSVSDQAYDGQWGYTGKVDTDIGYHTSTNGIYESGWYAYGDKSIDYTLHLDPGSYTLISGYKEWWGATRGMSFSAKNSAGTVLASKNFSINKNTAADQEEIGFTLEKADNVQISVSKVSGSDPVLAWLAVEKKMPVTTAVISPSSPDGNLNWYVNPVLLTLDAAETGGTVTGTVYSVDNATTWSTYSGPVTFHQDGQYSVSYYSTDSLGVEEYPKNITFQLDQTGPITTATPNSANPIESGKYSAPVTVTLAGTDNLSGMAKTVYSIDGQTWQTYSEPIELNQSGQYIVEYYSVDNAGNTEAAQSLPITINLELPTHSGNTDLAAIHLQMAAITPAFDKDIIDYTAVVPSSMASITVSASVYDLDSTLSIDGIAVASGEELSLSLDYGENSIPIQVTAKDMLTTKTYTVTILRELSIPATAQEIAAGITAVAAPARDAASLTLPAVPDGFSIAIRSTDKPDVITTDGVIIPPGTDTEVHLVFVVTRISDHSEADTASLTVTVLGRTPAVTGGNTENTTGAVPGSAPNPTSTTEPARDPAKLIVKAELDNATNVAVAVVSEADITEAFAFARDNDEGTKVIQIELPGVKGATAYELQLPAASLTSRDHTKVIQIKTVLGTMALPAHMFSAGELGNAKTVSVQIAEGDTSTIRQAPVISQIGTRPVIEVTMKADNKTITFNNADIPVNVSIPYEPAINEAKEADHLVILYMDDNGAAASVPSGKYDPEMGAMVFTTTHFSTFAVAQVYKTFADISGVGWANTQIEALASKGIINGTSETAYSPQEKITRADFISLLVSTLSLTAKFDTNFTDVKSTDYYYNAIGIAKVLGVTDGTGDNRFDPSAKISRQDMMTLTARAMLIANKLKAMDGTVRDLGSYSDLSKVSSYAVESAATLVKNGIVSGSGNNIAPLDYATRAETAVILYNVYKK